MRTAIRTVALLIVLLGAVPSIALAQDLTTVLVVRHAEKASDTEDPPLSAHGWERAAELLRVARESGVSTLYATQYLRTHQTLMHVAEGLGLEILEHDARDSEGLAARIRSENSGQVVLVAGHSNTVPAIVAALGAPQPEPIGDWQYDDLFVVTVMTGSEAATALHLKFGRATPAPD